MQVFGLYPNAKLVESKGVTFHIASLDFIGNRIHGISTHDHHRGCMYNLDPKLHSLILTPLSEINDEELIEIAKFFKWEEFRLNTTLAVLGVFIKAPNSSLTDYLRSKNYCLPYIGVDLIEAGIAIYKTK